LENNELFDEELQQVQQLLAEDMTQQEEQQPEKEEKTAVKKKEPWQKVVLSYLHDLVYLLAALIVVSMVFLRVVVVSGTSMYNTLVEGDYLLVLSNVWYQEPEYGDIVVISKESFDDGSPIVKRVIATEGQTVDINFTLGIVYVDGVALDEPYTFSPTTTHEGMRFPLVVEEGCIFVLGDNRAVSRDSRSNQIGLIDKNEVLGKVVFLFLPGTNGKDIFGYPNEPRDFDRIGVIG
jgi:signal peptidase I